MMFDHLKALLSFWLGFRVHLERSSSAVSLLLQVLCDQRGSESEDVYGIRM